MNRVQVVLSGVSVRLVCFVQAKTLCRYGCMYFLCVSRCDGGVWLLLSTHSHDPC